MKFVIYGVDSLGNRTDVVYAEFPYVDDAGREVAREAARSKLHEMLTTHPQDHASWSDIDDDGNIRL